MTVSGGVEQQGAAASDSASNARLTPQSTSAAREGVSALNQAVRSIRQEAGSVAVAAADVAGQSTHSANEIAQFTR